MPPPRTALFSCVWLSLALACSRHDEWKPTVFGGQGAVVTKEQPLPPEPAASATGYTGPCNGPAPPSDTALFDDFEDGDHKAFHGFEREAWWWAASDTTPGAKISPAKDQFKPERLPETEATKDNLFAVHLSAEGQKEWGAVWGSSLAWSNGGIKCPYNASLFGGVSVRAKGKGPVRVQLGIPETIGGDGGGQCKEGCWDSYGKVLFLTEKWQEFSIPWESLQQEGWGTQARFDPARLIQLSLQVKVHDLPVDFWVDDIKFLAKQGGAAKAP